MCSAVSTDKSILQKKFSVFERETHLNAEAQSKPGKQVVHLLLESGSCPNLKSKALFATINQMPTDTLGLHEALCFEKFKYKELTEDDKYHKSDLLCARMMHYCEIGQDGAQPELTEKKIHDNLAVEIDPMDGGLMFCYAKHGSSW
jgi:hypothetical protein